MIKISKYSEMSSGEVFARGTKYADVAPIVSGIIENVRTAGDRALFEYSEKFDKAKLDSLSVTKEEMDEAAAAVEPRFMDVLETAAANIRAYHQRLVIN
jgi:histidinol dehydrogenase